MVKFFFYKSMTNDELIHKINPEYELMNGHTSVHYYNAELNILEIGTNNMRKNVLLWGKLVSFNMSLDMVLQKINEIGECKFNGIHFENINRKYQVETVTVVDDVDHNIHDAYIVY
jgi:hypothetical protein